MPSCRSLLRTNTSLLSNAKTEDKIPNGILLERQKVEQLAMPFSAHRARRLVSGTCRNVQNWLQFRYLFDLAVH